ncbi:MAG: DNA primase [Campylobacteraceae bacterium]|jgi:DNA primase|nr:DNA primase [Campylobacteraceae bacterium]
MIDSSSIETLKQRIDIVDIVGSYLELKRSGSNFKAICPFHNDTRPSLYISPSKQIYHCFVCGAGGDAIKFVMEHEKLSYPEAVEKVADLCNFALTYTNTKDADNRKRTKEILEQLNLFFTQNLDKNPQAAEYLSQRGIGQSSIEKFEIGYAPQSHMTTNFLKRHFFTSKEAIEAGIISIGDRGDEYAVFMERITFPIYSANGKIAGFGGRTITNHPAKYLNSPQSKIFNKSELLYGYHIARESIMRNKKIIICEGYLDVVMLHQAGFNEAVATLGTALTEKHLPLIKRGEPKVILSYDGDNAGVEAAFKAAKLLSSHDMDGGVAIFTGDMDPADMVQKGMIDKLNAFYNSPKEFIEFCLEHIAGKYNLKNAHEKQKALEEAAAYLRTLPNAIAESYKSMLVSLLNVKPNLVVLGTRKPSRQNSTQEGFQDMLELSIIKTLLVNPHLIDMTLDIIDASMFKVHTEELSLLLEGQKEHPQLRKLLMLENINVHEEKELVSALRPFLIAFYEEEIEKIKKSMLEFEKKGFLFRKIRDIITRLRKGELVPYESFSSF